MNDTIERWRSVICACRRQEPFRWRFYLALALMTAGFVLEILQIVAR